MLDLSNEMMESLDHAREQILNAATTLAIYHRLNSDEALKKEALDELLKAHKNHSDLLNAIFPAKIAYQDEM